MDIVVESTYVYNYLEIVCPPKDFETTTSCDYLDIICSEHDKSLLIWDSTQKRWGCGLDTGSSYCCPFLIDTTMSPIPTTPMPITTSITSTTSTTILTTMATDANAEFEHGNNNNDNNN
eukprot:449081_1